MRAKQSRQGAIDGDGIMRAANRSLWIVPILLVLVAMGLFVTVAFTRAGTDVAALLGAWVVYSAVFVGFAILALVAYRSLRRSRDPEAADEARSRQSR
jgi:membrane protein implicated in regulation of membrane protease activity